MISRLMWVMLALGLSGPVWAVNPNEMLADPALEARARALSEDLRCVVCRNQNIDSSNASIARDMRLVLRERLVAGDTDEDAVRYIVDRFGDYVLLKPPWRSSTYLLWASPFIILIITIAGFSLLWRRAPEPAALPEHSAEDAELLAKLLNKDAPS